MESNTNIFEKLGLPKNPIMLAPLAGVSDHPFRRVCTNKGADLTYVEMISATAMLYNSEKTYKMLKRHDSEKVLGVQITGRSAEDVGQACDILNKMNFDTIDINMGCPVKKVVKTGSGSGILKDPERVYQTVKAAIAATDLPVSAKIRIGWDRSTVNYEEVTQAINEAGAAFMTVHGRTRSEDYSFPVDLESIAHLKKLSKIPVIGNGNIFSRQDADHMTNATGVDGLMVSRGALGNPWIFNEIKLGSVEVSVDEWVKAVEDHLTWQQEEYGDTGAGAICMRKHLLWYVKGWDGAKILRERINEASSLTVAMELLRMFVDHLKDKNTGLRKKVGPSDVAGRFSWDPKWEMDRKLDRGVGDDCLENSQ